jgi:hypothetical protein
LLDKSRYCTKTYVLVSMNGAANKRARAEAERVAATNAAGNHGGPPDAPSVAPPVAPAAALLPASQVVIGADALAQIIAACQPPPHVAGAGALLPERAGSTRLKAFSSTDVVVWMSWKMHYLKVCEINAWPNIRRVREARAAMAEKAARHTADVVPVYVPNPAANPPVQVTTWQDLISQLR